ncbi:MAG: tRNA preQ1(34) S-adenosylmethionine ribosyltransferase-isomerase QueA [Pseudomonadota bacterium]
MNNIKNYNYMFPEELIAKYPNKNRDDSKMLIVDRENQSFSHNTFKQFPNYINENDIIVYNDVRVEKVRFFAKRQTGGKVEILLLKQINQNDRLWEAMVNSSRSLRKDENLILEDNTTVIVIKEKVNMSYQIYFDHSNSTYENSINKDFIEYHLNWIDYFGQMPIPPYLKRDYDKDLDGSRYQTVYAQKGLACAAPTAGLHFTENILNILKEKNIKMHPVTLNVGIGTFLPVRSENILEHKMHYEEYFISTPTYDAIKIAKENRNKIIAIGTTSVRTIESFFTNKEAKLDSWNKTEMYIYPGYEFKAVGGLLTNFHQPKSSLFIMVSAFASQKLMQNAYEEAIREKYRLFSYGDCMLIL